jgi:S-adenosylmethionine-diacylglycerol 3-amino-3-carboxypropyl transferase
MKKQIDNLRDKLFSKVHGNNLVYNTCWEDPKIDRNLLDINDDSEVVMITSAGCNALEYLLDNPAKVHAIDVNYRQNSLLELKRAIFEHCTFEELFAFFGNGYNKNSAEIYNSRLRPHIPKYAQEFWDKKLYYFYKNAKKKSFYFFGTSGTFAWLFNKYIHRNKKRSDSVKLLFSCKSIEEQKEVYRELEPLLISRFVKWLMNRHITMSLLGVPRPQRDLILNEYPLGGVGEFAAKRLKYIFTELPIHENYFWYLYTYGQYSIDNCPEYLKSKNFKAISARAKNLKTHNSTVQSFLESHPKAYSHYILLDHQDWLAHYAPEALKSEWKEILKNSKSGTKILMRSASMKIDFFPDFVLDAVDFSPLAAELHKKDRVGTYGSTYLAIVK